MKTLKTFAILTLATTFAIGPVSSAWASRRSHSRHYSHHSRHSSHGDVWGAAIGGTMLGLMLGAAAAQPAVPDARPQVVVIHPPKVDQRPRPSASSFDPYTGLTTSASYNANGNVEIVVTDSNGNVISRRVRDRRVGASSYDPTTGRTTSSYRQADGSVQVTVTDSNGNVINQWNR